MKKPRHLSWQGGGLVIRTVLTIMIVDVADFRRVDVGELFGLFHDAAIDVGVLDPGAVDGDAADSATSVAEVPVGAFAVAVTLSGIYFHVIAVATQGYFESFGARHNLGPPFVKVTAKG